jgi:hypothetical protein
MPKVAVDPQQIVARIRASMDIHPCLPASELRVVRRHLPLVATQLRTLGYEVGKNYVRRPLAAQILALCADRPVPLKGLEKKLSGASAGEVKSAVAALVQQGELRPIMRQAGTSIACSRGTSALRLLRDAELAECLQKLTQVQKLARSALNKKPARFAVMPEDLFGPLQRWLQVLVAEQPDSADSADSAVASMQAPVRPAAAAAAECANGKNELSRRIHAHLAGASRPIRVPELLRALGVGGREGKPALLLGATLGLFGLEPESGMGRLSPEDAELCPVGPNGTRLSWVVARSMPVHLEER